MLIWLHSFCSLLFIHLQISVIVILKSLPTNNDIWFISSSASIEYFISWFFVTSSCFLHIFFKTYWSQYMIYCRNSGLCSPLKSAEYFSDFSPKFGLLSFYVYLYMCSHHSIVISPWTSELCAGCLILWVGTQALLAVDFYFGSGAGEPRGGSSRPVLSSSLHPQGRGPPPEAQVHTVLLGLLQDWSLDPLTGREEGTSLQHPSESGAQSPKCDGFSPERRNQGWSVTDWLCHRHRAGPPRVLWPVGTPLPGLLYPDLPQPQWPRQQRLTFSQTWSLEAPGVSSPGCFSGVSPWHVAGLLPSESAPNLLFLEGYQSCWVRAPPIWPHFTFGTFWNMLSPKAVRFWSSTPWLQHINLGGNTFQPRSYASGQLSDLSLSELLITVKAFNHMLFKKKKISFPGSWRVISVLLPSWVFLLSALLRWQRSPVV